jgi:uncharacterized protein (DUF697 family)
MSERTATGYNVVRRYVKWSAAAGLVTLPIIDIAAVTAVQLKMVADLSKLYEIPFSHERAKAIVGALVGAVAPQILAGAFIGSAAPLIGAVPIVGPVIGIAARPTFNAASTYALGKVFIQHFESGGTLLDMDPDALRAHFRREFQSAKA